LLSGLYSVDKRVNKRSQMDRSIRRRHKAPNLCQDLDQRGRPDEGTLPTHVSAGEDLEAGGLVSRVDLVWHVVLLPCIFSDNSSVITPMAVILFLPYNAGYPGLVSFSGISLDANPTYHER
jgi:hypothetical protein